MTRTRLLLDTTYILPVLGVGVRLPRYEELFPRLLEAYEAYYTPLSLVEAKWIILRLARRSPGLREELLREYRAGVETLRADERLHETIVTNGAIEEAADRLLALGVRDYFDRMIYATALYYSAVLLTEDRELHRLGASTDPEPPRPPAVVSWEELLRGLG